MALTCNIKINNKSSYQLNNPVSILSATTIWEDGLAAPKIINGNEYGLSKLVGKSFEVTSIDGSVTYDMNTGFGVINHYTVSCANSQIHKDASSKLEIANKLLITSFKCKVGDEDTWADNMCNYNIKKDQDVFVEFTLLDTLRGEDKNSTFDNSEFNSQMIPSKQNDNLINPSYCWANNGHTDL